MLVSGVVGRCLVQITEVIKRQTKLGLLQLGEFVFDREAAAAFRGLVNFRSADRIFLARYLARRLTNLELLASITTTDNARADPVILLSCDFGFLDVLGNDKTDVSFNKELVSCVFGYF